MADGSLSIYAVYVVDSTAKTMSSGCDQKASYLRLFEKRSSVHCKASDVNYNEAEVVWRDWRKFPRFSLFYRFYRAMFYFQFHDESRKEALLIFIFYFERQYCIWEV